MPTAIAISDFISLAQQQPVIDVRTPAEFAQGHIPGAVNIPLFSNEERAVVGTIYKQQGREPAIMKGLELVGPKMKSIVEEVKKISDNQTVLVHCWRGGMRSASVAWLLELVGYKVHTLKGGYKFFRRQVMEIFSQPHNFMVLGGKTGSGKTHVLKLLKEKGEQIIDLEALAKHKGSSFGKLGEDESPTQEHFENLLAMQLVTLNSKQTCWVEDESRLIGNKVVPDSLWKQMREAKVLFVDVPLIERVNFLIDEYGKYSVDELKEATLRIKKRLGGQHAKAALEALNNGDLKTACEINLVYYDKAYIFGLEKRNKKNIETINVEKVNPEMIAEEIIKWKK